MELLRRLTSSSTRKGFMTNIIDEVENVEISGGGPLMFLR